MIFFPVIETTKSNVRYAYIRKIFKANVGKKGEFQSPVFSPQSTVHSLQSTVSSLQSPVTINQQPLTSNQ